IPCNSSADWTVAILFPTHKKRGSPTRFHVRNPLFLFLLSEQICKNLCRCHIPVAVRVCKYRTAPGKVIDACHITLACDSVAISLISNGIVFTHILFCQLDRFAVCTSAGGYGT